MSHDDKKGLKVLENEILHLIRLNGLNSKMVRETAWLVKQSTKVNIKRADGTCSAV